MNRYRFVPSIKLYKAPFKSAEVGCKSAGYINNITYIRIHTEAKTEPRNVSFRFIFPTTYASINYFS